MFSINQDTLPESDDELELHMQVDYKDDIEIAEEKAIETTLKYNNFDIIKKRVDEDANCSWNISSKAFF